MTRRVVVTGMGLVTALGNDLPTTWQALCEGRSGVDTIRSFPLDAFPVPFAAEVKDFDATQYLDRKEVRRTEPYAHFAFAAARQALDQSGLVVTAENAPEIGVCVGSCLGGLLIFADTTKVILEKGPARVNPLSVPLIMTNGAPALISIQCGLQGPNWALVSAHTTGSNAIGESWEMIRRGDVEVMLAGAADKSVLPITMAAFYNMQALSTRLDNPQAASRPFDAQRGGFVMGEGAGVVVLEELEHARARGALILAELVGYGTASDAYHITQIDPEGRGLVKAMQKALRKAGLEPEQIDYLNPHGTGTLMNDAVETYAIKKCFGEHAYKMPISATKSMLGHAMGASGAIEAVVTVQSLVSGMVHPTINLDYPDPDCDLDYVPRQARELRIRYAMSNSLGFGGHNTSLVFSRFQD